MNNQTVIWLIVMAAILTLCNQLADNRRGDFTLSDNQQLIVNSYHYQGDLYDILQSGLYPPIKIKYWNIYGMIIEKGWRKEVSNKINL